MTSPLHPNDGQPNVATPGTRPGEQKVPATPTQCDPERAATPPGAGHTPRRDGDNSGGESTASERRSSDKGHQHTPRPGDHQGGH